MNKPDKLVIFDYSGTLSLESPRFGRPENLARALEESGLFSLGVTTPEIFWEEIVGPTWAEGSTTTKAYKRVMAERIEALHLAPDATITDIFSAASCFADRFMDHSWIDPNWRPLLETLARHTGTVVVIATDHYAEMTGTVIRNLRAWDLQAQKAGDRTEAPFVVANSADIGFWKSDRRFWEVLKTQHSLEAVRSVFIVDDFGFNETEGDRYGRRSGIEARREKTVAVLEDVFHASVEVVPFYLNGGEREDPPVVRISEAIERIGRFLDRAKNIG
jgi:hypothetical protein